MTTTSFNGGMNRLIYAPSDRNEDLLYATKFSAPDHFLYFEKGGRSHIALNALEYDRGCREAKVDCVINLTAWLKGISHPLKEPKGSLSPADWISWLLKFHGVQQISVARESSVSLVEGLRKKKIRVKVVDGVFFPEREIKRKEEIKALRHSLRVTSRLLERAIKVIRASKPNRFGRLKWGGGLLTSERMQAEIRMEAARYGFEAWHPIVAGGRQGCDPHERGHGPLRTKELIVLDIFPRDLRTGYWGDMTRTVVKGRASEAQRKQFDAVRDAQKLVFQKLKAGVNGQDMHSMVKTLFEKRGYTTGRIDDRYQGFFHGTGHGLGLEIHESPRLSSDPQKILEGHVVTVEPGLYYAETGGVRIEDVAWVRADNAEKLSQFPIRLEI